MIKKPMLAGRVEDETALRFPLLASPKLDGIRCVLVERQALTRSFKPIPNAYVRERLETITLQLGPNVALDGELTLADPVAPFTEVSSAIMSKDGEPDFMYRVFDRVGLDLGLSHPFSARLAVLEHTVKRLPKALRATIEVVEHREVTSAEQLGMLEHAWLAEGYEGVMLRDPFGPYKCGRSTFREHYLLKLKRFSDAEAVIVGVEEQQTNLNPSFRGELGQTKRSSAKAGRAGAAVLGALLVRDCETGVEFGIGTGFDEAARVALWLIRDKLIGSVVKYKSQSTGVKDRPRFPTFISFRDRKDM